MQSQAKVVLTRENWDRVIPVEFLWPPRTLFMNNNARSATRWITKAAIVCLVTAVTSSVYADQKLRIVVRIPANTAKTESVYLAGSLLSVGGGKADGLKLVRQEDGTFVGDARAAV